MGTNSIPDQLVGFVVQKLERDKIFSNYIGFPVSNIPPVLNSHTSFTYHRHYTNLASEGIVNQTPSLSALLCVLVTSHKHVSFIRVYTGLFISPSGISELDCATTKADTAERSISIGRESLKVFFILGALAYFQVPPLGGSRDEKWRSQ